MYKRAGHILQPHLRNKAFHAHAAAPAIRFGSGRRSAAVVSAIVVGSMVWYADAREVHNDAGEQAASKAKDTSAIPASSVNDPNNLHSLVWGSNRSGVLYPTTPFSETIRTPTIASWLDGVALRDLAFHEKHAACVDAKGDVYQWGDGYFGGLLPEGVGRSPKLTLRGKNIVQVQLSEDKLYALSASGNLYVIATKALDQVLPAGAPTPASDSWWGTGWFWGEDETVDFAKISPNDQFGWGERFVSIAAGKNHLLALTSKGRAFAHPINKMANHYGQLGFRKFDIPDPASHITDQKSHLHVDLIPKSLADPFENSSRSARVTSTASPHDDLGNINDKGIRFCPTIYEIPVLRGIEVAQVAAGGRSSFIRTPNGRVLGWGANEYGQIGLGSNVALDTITVPTEVILWRSVPSRTSSNCKDVTAGGDLTAFTVDRVAETGVLTTDLLMSGNGQFGGLGNNSYSTSQGNPVRVKAISGLQQYNDRTKTLEPIKPDDISVSHTGHVLLALDSSAGSPGVGGSDLMVWGRNYDSELGNGKKSSAALPIALELSEGGRLMLMEKKAKVVRDLHGKVWKRGVKVEQRAATGYGNSTIYWKVVDLAIKR